MEFGELEQIRIFGIESVALDASDSSGTLVSQMPIQQIGSLFIPVSDLEHCSSTNNLKRRINLMIIETKIIEKPAFSVVGITEMIHFDSTLPPSENAIAKLWGRFGKRIPEVTGQLGWRSFGLMLQNPNNPPGAPFDYTAAVQINQDGGIPEGMTRVEVPAARYIVLTLRGPLDSISDAFGHFWGHWLPNSPYEYDGGTLTGKYEFEFYDQRYTRPDDANSEIDLYFPIRAK